MTTKAVNIFSGLHNFLEANDLSFSKAIGICTEGPQAMSGYGLRFVELGKKKNSKIIVVSIVLFMNKL